MRGEGMRADVAGEGMMRADVGGEGMMAWVAVRQ